jgi:hypothetical protein
MSTRMEYFDFGSAVDFNVPNDDEVQDLSALTPGSKFSTVASSIN